MGSNSTITRRSKHGQYPNMRYEINNSAAVGFLGHKVAHQFNSFKKKSAAASFTIQKHINRGIVCDDIRSCRDLLVKCIELLCCHVFPDCLRVRCFSFHIAGDNTPPAVVVFTPSSFSSRSPCFLSHSGGLYSCLLGSSRALHMIMHCKSSQQKKK